MPLKHFYNKLYEVVPRCMKNNFLLFNVKLTFWLCPLCGTLQGNNCSCWSSLDWRLRAATKQKLIKEVIPIEWFTEAFWLVLLLWQQSGAHQKVGQSLSFRGSNSRNKVSVGEPAEESLLMNPNGYKPFRVQRKSVLQPAIRASCS